MKINRLLIAFVLFAALLLSGCDTNASVGELHTESQSVELEDAGPVRVEIKFGAGDLQVTGGAEKLLEADFAYNVARLKPEVKYTDGKLVVKQPTTKGLPNLADITDFRNTWGLRLSDKVPMDLSVDVDGGSGDLQLAGLSLTGLDINLGAGTYTIDLSGDWAQDLDVSIDAGAASLSVRLPGNVGVRVTVEAGPHTVDAAGLTKNGSVYTNAAYGESEVTMLVDLQAGIGQIFLEVDEQTQAKTELQNLVDRQVENQDILGMVMAERLADGTVIWAASGYTTPSGTEPWSATTASFIASVTKTFTAVVVMQLVEEGKLSLDDTIDAWLPEQPDGNSITVRMLLSHTSGLADYAFGTDFEKWARDWEPEELIAEANKAGPVGKPGSRIAHYSNPGYIMLGLIIEKITGNSWAYEVESRIIQPLGLKDTTIAKDGMWTNGDVIPGYVKTPDGYVTALELFPVPPSISTAWAAGGIVSTASDLMTFACALFDGKLVSSETLAIMTEPVGTEGQQAWALGGGVGQVAGHKIFAMGGDTTGYHAFFAGIPDSKLVVTAMVNTDEGNVILPSMAALQSISQQIANK